MNITLDELQAFAAVVDTGSITAAAQQLNLTVSATSRTLARLEEKLKTTLLPHGPGQSRSRGPGRSR